MIGKLFSNCLIPSRLNTNTVAVLYRSDAIRLLNLKRMVLYREIRKYFPLVASTGFPSENSAKGMIIIF